MAGGASHQQSVYDPTRTLASDTAMDAVTLRVGDLELMSSYYADALALEPVEERAHGREVHRVLGRGTVPMVRLIATPDLPGVDPSEAGLFHTAFLFEDAASLAATVHRAAKDSRSRFVGSSDHLVSEAFYFTDPEGNGIELYIDRDRSEWSYAPDGELRMATDYLDPNAFLRTHLDESTVDAAPRLPGRSATSTCRSETWTSPATSTSTPSASRPPCAVTRAPSSPRPAATTTTSR